LIEAAGQHFSAKANIGAADVKPRSGGRSQKTLSKVGINELLRGI
jgi:hypothetical protein